MKRKIMKKTYGFSLVEMVIYVALLVIMVTAVAKPFSYMFKSYRDIKAAKSLALSASTILNRFDYEVRKSTALSGTYGTSSGSLTLTQSSSTVTFGLQNNRVIITSSGVIDYLNASDTAISNLTFYSLAASSTSKGVILQFTISNTSAPIHTENFETALLLKNPQ